MNSRICQTIALFFALSPLTVGANLVAALKNRNLLDDVQLVQVARAECAKVQTSGHHEYELCIDDVLRTKEEGMVGLWPDQNEDELSEDDKLLREARIACSSVQEDKIRLMSPSPQIDASSFENCVEEVVHSGNVDNAKLWTEDASQRNLRGSQ